jgi:hypothetical protein
LIVHSIFRYSYVSVTRNPAHSKPAHGQTRYLDLAMSSRCKTSQLYYNIVRQFYLTMFVFRCRELPP